MGETTEGGAPTPPNPGATTTDASAAQFPTGQSGATPTPDTGGTLAPGSVEEGAPTTGGTVSGVEEPPREDEGDGAGSPTWSSRADEP
jgi:hypothetical protein